MGADGGSDVGTAGVIGVVCAGARGRLVGGLTDVGWLTLVLLDVVVAALVMRRGGTGAVEVLTLPVSALI